MALVPGTRLGVFELIEQIGRGGMGEVYRARDTKLNRDVALKVLPDSFASDADRLARFTREAQTLASLNHPNIAHIHGLEESGGVRALVMELVEGDDLSQRIAGGPIPTEDALTIARQIAEALEAAHEQGIIHRDLKPANIKVRPDGTVKVLDFGLAKAMEQTGAMSPSMSQAPTITTPAMTQAGMILGTAAYMSPEQARGKTVDQRTDIWAFGCLLYEMLTGRQAFSGETVADVIASVLSRDPDLSLLPVGVSVRTQQLLCRALEKDPRGRWHAIGDLRWELEAAVGEPATVPIPAVHAGIHSRWRPRISMLMAAATGAVLVGAGLVLLRPPPPSNDGPSVLLTVQPNQVFANPGVSEIALSPDGRQLVFTDSGPAGKALWVRSLGTGDVRLLQGTEGAWYPFWSPDSRFVGFYTDGALKRVPIDGGPGQTISAASSAGGATWSPAGMIVFGTDRGLFQVSASGGTPTALTTLDQAQLDLSHVFPQFLPGGDQLLYFVNADRPERRGVYVRSLGLSDVRRVMDTDSPAVFVEPGYLLTVEEQVLLAYPLSAETVAIAGEPTAIADNVGRESYTRYPSASASSNGVLAYGSASGIGLTQLVWSDRRGRRLPSIGSPESVIQVRLSPDGTRAALLKRDPKTNLNNIWISELSTQVSALFAPDSGDPIWSPDGRRLAFNGRRDGPQLRLYDKPLGGGDERLLLGSRGNLEDWTKDGQSIIFRDAGATFLLPLSGSRTPKELFSAEPSTSRNQFHLSPDGQWIAYTSDESGTPDVWVASFPTFTDRRQVSKGGGDVPRWRNDQRELYYLAPDGGMMSVDVAIGTTIQTGAPARLFDTRILASGGFDRYDVTGDGQRFLLLEPPASSAVPPITVITNWTSLLR